MYDLLVTALTCNGDIYEPVAVMLDFFCYLEYRFIPVTCIKRKRKQNKI